MLGCRRQDTARPKLCRISRVIRPECFQDVELGREKWILPGRKSVAADNFARMIDASGDRDVLLRIETATTLYDLI